MSDINLDFTVGNVEANFIVQNNELAFSPNAISLVVTPATDIGMDVTVNNTTANFSVETNQLAFTPSAITMSISTAGIPLAGGPVNSIQYNNSGQLDGSSVFNFDANTSTVNIYEVNVTSYANLGNVGNIGIGGGVNGYILQTDGAGNLTWTAQTGNATGNGSVGGANSQVQYNDNGNFNGNSGFTFNKSTGVVGIDKLNISNNITFVGNGNPDITVSNNLSNANARNITVTAGNVSNTLTSNTTAGIITINSGNATSNDSGNVWGARGGNLVLRAGTGTTSNGFAWGGKIGRAHV